MRLREGDLLTQDHRADALRSWYEPQSLHFPEIAVAMHQPWIPAVGSGPKQENEKQAPQAFHSPEVSPLNP